MPSVNLGRVSIVPKGVWSNSTNYEKLDVVTYGGGSYIANKDVPAGTSLSTAEYWSNFVGSFNIGTVETVSASTGASAELITTSTGQTLNLQIPRGVAGNESIDDSKGEGDTDYVWSADKNFTENNKIQGALFISETQTVSLVLGTLSLSDGTESASNTRSRTTFIPFDDSTKVVAELGAKYAFRFYKADDSWSGAPTIWYTGENNVKEIASNYTNAAKMRLVCAYSDDRDLQTRSVIDALELLISYTSLSKDRISEFENVSIPLNWKLGNIGMNNGVDGVSTTRVRTYEYVPYNENDVATIKSGFKFSVRGYSSNKEFIWTSSFLTDSGKIGTLLSALVTDDTKYLRFVVADASDAEVTDVIGMGNNLTLSFAQTMQSVTNTLTDFDDITISESATGNLAIRCAKEQSYADGTPPVIDWFLLESPSGEFYYSKDLKDKVRLFTFPHESYKYSFGILQNGDIIAVLDADSIETDDKSDDNRQNPYVYLASEKWAICHEVDFGSDPAPCGWLENCGFKVLANGSAIFCEYTRQTTYTANVWKLSGDPTDASNWEITKSFIVTSTDNSTGFKHCHMVMQDFYTGICYMSTGDDNTGAMLYYSSDNGDTWTQLVSPDSDGQTDEHGWKTGSEKYCRMLTMTFTEDYIYWGSDTPTESLHYLFKAERDSDTGILDYSTVTDYVNIPAVSHASTYGTAYLPELNAILLLDRCDSYAMEMPVRIVDLGAGTLTTIGKLYVTENEKGTGANLGFRTRFSEWYPLNCELRFGFDLRGNRYNNAINHNRGFGNTGTWMAGNGINNINNLVLRISKDGSTYRMNMTTLYI